MKAFETGLLLVVTLVLNITIFINYEQQINIQELSDRIEKLEQQAHPAHKGASLEQLIELKRKQQCGELKRLPCLMATGYWR